MNRLRNKLSDEREKNTYIKTLWGIGYKMEEE
ncbi:winged helix-turn-helix domain-containing protein [Dorea amylophila]|nr:winged helix-turn-helix domain-containing protein [Dorea amylophila]